LNGAYNTQGMRCGTDFCGFIFKKLYQIHTFNLEKPPAIDELDRLIRREPLDDESARHLTERMTIALQAAVLLSHASYAIADAFCATRLAGDGGMAFGTMPAAIDHNAILERNFVQGRQWVDLPGQPSKHTYK
jgi:hypothetical protein